MSSAVVISDEQVESWIRQASEIDDKIETLSGQKDTLHQWIAAANLLRNAAEKSQSIHSDTKVEHSASVAVVDVKNTASPLVDDDGPSLVDAIVMALRAAGKPQSNKEIKAKLAGTGFDVQRLKSSPNYFYTAAKRLVDRGSIEKLKDGRYVLNNDSDPDEDSLFGSSSGSDYHTGDYQSGEPRAQGREAVPGGGP